MPGLKLINNLGDAESAVKTPWAVCCQNEYSRCTSTVDPLHPQRIFLTQAAYYLQMERPDLSWSCPRCGHYAEWSDANFEEFMEDGQ